MTYSFERNICTYTHPKDIYIYMCVCVCVCVWVNISNQESRLFPIVPSSNVSQGRERPRGLQSFSFLDGIATSEILERASYLKDRLVLRPYIYIYIYIYIYQLIFILKRKVLSFVRILSFWRCNFCINIWHSLTNLYLRVSFIISLRLPDDNIWLAMKNHYIIKIFTL